MIGTSVDESNNEVVSFVVVSMLSSLLRIKSIGFFTVVVVVDEVEVMRGSVSVVICFFCRDRFGFGTLVVDVAVVVVVSVASEDFRFRRCCFFAIA